MSSTSKVCDFTRSFVRWSIDTTVRQPKTVSHRPPFTLNNVRVMPTCLAEVVDRRKGTRASYLLGASCKTEYVNVQSGIWTEPNADFCVVAGPDRALAIKRWDIAGKGVPLFPATLGMQPERQPINPADAFTAYGADIRKTEGRLLSGIEEIDAAFASDRQVVSRSQIDAAHFSLTLEYPCVTANFSLRDRYYQLDTGPLLLPDLSVPADAVLESFQLAYVAHCGANWAEFLVSAPTPVGNGISVHHFSRTVRTEGRNELYAVGAGT